MSEVAIDCSNKLKATSKTQWLPCQKCWDKKKILVYNSCGFESDDSEFTAYIKCNETYLSIYMYKYTYIDINQGKSMATIILTLKFGFQLTNIASCFNFICGHSPVSDHVNLTAVRKFKWQIAWQFDLTQNLTLSPWQHTVTRVTLACH